MNIEIIEGGFAKETTTHDVSGTWTRFYISKESAQNAASGAIEICHLDKSVTCNVQLRHLTPAEALKWSNLLTEAAIFANALPD